MNPDHIFFEFVREHLNDDISRLALNRSKWPEIDFDLALNTIESRRKLRGKVLEWADNPHLIFPLKLSAEQCSSSATGKYKAGVAERIAKDGHRDLNGWKIADLTGGLGVDSWHFSQLAEKVTYCEMKSELCRAAEHNFKVLNQKNINIINTTIGHDSPISALLSDFRPDIIYLDPARRGEGGKKVFLIEECTPDILKIKDDLFEISRHILLKLSPMADITMVCSRLGSHCREVHIVSVGNECKELLVWMDRNWEGEYSIHTVELSDKCAKTEADFIFTPSQERNSSPILATSEEIQNACFLFEPGKALMKAGAFNLISERFGLMKLGKSTHYYLYCADKALVTATPQENTIKALCDIGKLFCIDSVLSLDKRSFKTIKEKYPKADVTARNIPMDSETLSKKIGMTGKNSESYPSGLNPHIFGLKSDIAGNLLFACFPER